jgi:hypothetical protein
MSQNRQQPVPTSPALAVDGVGGAKQRRLEEDKLATDGEMMQVPGLIDLLEDLPEDFTFDRGKVQAGRSDRFQG